MDIFSLKTNKADVGVACRIKHPATEEVIEGVTLTLLGMDSAKNRAIQRKKQQAALDRLSKGKKAMRLVAEDLDEDAIGDLADITTAWTGVTKDGNPVEFTRDNVVMVYTELPWMREQAQDFVNDRANFL